MSDRSVVLVTGASRRIGIGAAIVSTLAVDGWDVATTYLRAYDTQVSPGSELTQAEGIVAGARALGARTLALEADLSETSAPARVFDAVEAGLGPVTALVMSHCYSVESDILSTTVESFDRHYEVNVRATWLLIRELGRRFGGPRGSGRIVALTSDHVVGNVPYGSSKAALDRIVLAAAGELGHLGISANAVNPGPTDTGWMEEDLKRDLVRATPLGRLGTAQDCAELVRFLCSPEGGWVNGQVLKSNGGIG